MSSPTFVNSSSASQTTAGTSLVANLPASINDGDLLLAHVATTGGVVTTPSGWTFLERVRGFGAAAPAGGQIYARLASSEPASYTWNLSSSTEYNVIYHAYRPSSGSWSTIWDAIVAAVPFEATSATTQVVPAIQLPATMDMMLVTFMALGRGSTTTTKPTSYTLAQNPDSGGTGTSATESGGAYLSVTNGSASSTSWTTTNSGAYTTFHIALKDPGTAVQRVVRTYEQEANGGNGQLATGSVDVLFPGCAVGDLLAVFISSSSSTALTIPSGWALLMSDTVSGGSSTGFWYWKVADGSEVNTTISWTRPSGTADYVSSAFVVSNATQFWTFTSLDDTSSNTTWTFPGLTHPAQSPNAVVLVGWTESGGSVLLSTYPTGYQGTGKNRTGNGAGNILGASAYKIETGSNPASGSFTGAGSITGTGFMLSTGFDTVFAADAVTTSDAVVEAVSKDRTASDAVTTSDTAVVPSDDVTATDAITTSDSVARMAALTRSSSDTVTISSPATRTVSLTRTATDAVTVSATPVVRTPRTASDAVTVATTVSVSQALTRRATDALTVSTDVDSTGGIGPPPPPPVTPAIALIRLDGIDITADVVMADAEFTQQANGQPGSARFRIRDLGHTYSPTPGQTLTLDINDVRVWGGWAMRVSPGYFFAVDDTTDAQETERLWLIEGVDYNILFSKRYLINKANPTQMLKNYPAGTPDDQIVLDVVSKYLELAGDGISTAGVTHVGTPNPDDPGNIGNPGASWGAAMSIIAAPTQAVFYIGPDKVLYYVDVETVTAPFMLSDAPVVVQEVGFRDMEINFDGTKLVNDALVWGAGAHATPDITFKRVHDQDSIDEHGRWQLGEFTTALFTDAGVNQRAQSYVYGSPQSKRGGKDDSVQVMCTIYEPGLTAGMVVAFASNVFGYEDVLPIRRMGIRFPTPTNVEFKLYLSWDVDAPWADYEFWFPKVNFDYPNPPVIDYPHIWDHVLPPVPGDCQCGITDSFDRTIAANNTSIGVSDAGIPWDVFDGGVGATVEVDPTDGLIINVPAAETFGTEVVLPGLLTASPELDVTYRVRFTDFVVGESSRLDLNYLAFLRLVPGISSGSVQTISVGLNTAHFDVAWVEDTWYNIHIGTTDGRTTLLFGIWPDGDSDNTAEFFNGLIDFNDGSPVDFSWEAQNQGSPGIFRMEIDTLSISNYDSCTAVQFDDFQRTIFPGWGVSTPSGFEWATTGDFTQVIPGLGVLTPNDSGSALSQARAAADVAGPWDGDFTMLIRFQFPSVPSGSTASSTYLLVVADTDGLYSSEIAIEPAQTTGDVTIWSGSGPPLVGTNARSFSRAWVAGDWYYLRWVHERPSSGTDMVTIWPEGDPEPSTPDVTMDIFAGSLSGPEFELIDIAIHAHGSEDWYISSIDFDYADRPCYYDDTTPVPPVDAPSVSGTRCDTFLGGGTVFTMVGPYQAQTTKAYIDGVFQPLGVVYAETNPGAGTVTFGSTTPFGSVITICYIALVGGS